jgi:hypothetical protein
VTDIKLLNVDVITHKRVGEVKDFDKQKLYVTIDIPYNTAKYTKIDTLLEPVKIHIVCSLWLYLQWGTFGSVLRHPTFSNDL